MSDIPTPKTKVSKPVATEPEEQNDNKELKQADVINKTYPKFRFYNPDLDKFFFSGKTLFFRKEKKAPEQFVMPYTIELTEDIGRDLKGEDLQNLSEFTGILDSSEEQNAIFSGDIVKVPDGRGYEQPVLVVVSWIPSRAMWNISPYLITGNAMYVTGNLYQKWSEGYQELLKAEAAAKGTLDLTNTKGKVVN